ncbi:MAG: leucine-rich repeat protein, partial [Clostridiales bacterium]|nr:leucine-rich repeat protein [Clostridiales bacterium]
MVQAMIDTLPEAAEITEENASDVEARLDAIDEAKSALYQTGGDVDGLDMSRYDAACAALAALRELEETGEDLAESAAATGVLSSAVLTATDDTVEYNGLKFDVVNLSNSVSLVNNSYAGTTYTIPSNFMINSTDYYVLTIADSAFSGCRNLTSITFEKTGGYYYLEEISSSAFYACTKLSSINLPDSLENINSLAFWGCTSLTTITIPDSVTKIGGGAFADCTGLQTLKLPDNKNLSVDSSAFDGCKNLVLTVPVFTDTLDTYTGVKSINYYYARPSGVTLSSDGTVTWTGLNATNVQYRVELCTGITAVSTQYVSAVSGQTSYSCTFDASDLAGDYYARVTAIAPTNSTVSISASTPVTSGLLAIYSPRTIYFASEGRYNTISATTGSDGTLYSLETPTRPGYIFNGWYTEKDGGEEVTTSTVFTSDQVVYGQWTLCTHKGNEAQPTCTEDATCSVCGGTIEATGHTAGEAVKENEVAATCSTEGSYDSVVYCSVCGEEISRETVTVAATGH